VVEYDRCGVGAKTAVGFGGDGGGSVDDILKRISSLEIQVSSIAAAVPRLATKADFKNELAEVRTEISKLKVDIASMEPKIINWLIPTVLASIGVAFTIAKLTH
jgi:hypothetical protein